MNKRILLLAGAISALFAGKSTSTTPAALELEPVTGAVDIRVEADFAPTPAKPVAPAVAEQKVVLRQAPLASVGFSSFVERPMRRKVKYGKSRWVILG